MASPAGPSRSEALERMTQALEAAKRARDRGANVYEARGALKAARIAFMKGDYAAAMERANYILGTLDSGTFDAAAAATSLPAATAPGRSDLAAAAGRLAEATDTVKVAKANGFNVQAAKVALKQAKRAFKAKDYAGTIQFADQAIQLSGSTGRTRI